VNVQVLIDSLVQQVTVLIAQLATSGGVRAPVAHIANQVFVDLARELAAQGVSRKVSADMFGMALRAYQRKLRRLTAPGREREGTLWRAVLDAIAAEGLLSRGEIVEQFSRDDEVLVRGVLRDLVDSGVLACSGQGNDAQYRLLGEQELRQRMPGQLERGFDELLCALVYRGGPVQLDALAERLQRPAATIEARLAALCASGRLQRGEAGYFAEDLTVPLSAEAGWEAAVFDHVQAVVQTICQRLAGGLGVPKGDERVGGSTYSFDVWEGHPFAAEVEAALARFRAQHGELRARVDAWNQAHGRPARYVQYVLYGGQCAIERGSGAAVEEDGERVVESDGEGDGDDAEA
jgi:hypothetical protein